MGNHFISESEPLRDRSETDDVLEKLIAENVQLRRTAVDLALETMILREGLFGTDPTNRELRNRRH